MSSRDRDALQGTLTLEGAQVAVLGYDADAREHALALRRAGNTVTLGLTPDTDAWQQARGDGFAVDQPGAVVANAEVVVVRARDDQALWRQGARCVAPGTLVVFACARALQHGACASSGMDVALVTTADDDRVGCRIAVHRDVTRGALLRAVAYARAAFPPGTLLRGTSVALEAELELAAAGERTGNLLALTLSSAPLISGAPPRPNATDDERELAERGEEWLQWMLDRIGPW